jgi:uncharacterized phage protein (TIGR01671 family)|tara:strand:- start:1276 stop:1632 length:357 start_codon:yes stop_codon:yes gene_type:complete
MRDIKFRGKRVDNGEWVYGDLYRIMGFGTGPHWLIGTPETADYKDPEVDPETVGQFTGRQDEVKKSDVYEGDLVESFTNTGRIIREIKYEAHRSTFLPLRNWYKVIGNIHDNRDLVNG